MIPHANIPEFLAALEARKKKRRAPTPLPDPRLAEALDEWATKMREETAEARKWAEERAAIAEQKPVEKRNAEDKFFLGLKRIKTKRQS
jgi:hypothetical protein